MRITRAAVERLAGEIGQRSGRNPVENISRPGKRTAAHYVMAGPDGSTYRGARLAAAYLLGVLAGLDPEGLGHWISVMPAWIQVIDGEFEFGQIEPAAVAAHHTGMTWGTTLRPAGTSRTGE